jgi:hypothetical protein
MNRKKLMLTLLVAIVLTLVVASTALAAKRVYKAQLSAANELHEVVGSSARGSAVFSRRPDGLDFMLVVRGLSGAPTGAHIHAPADATQTAGVVLTLCGNPAPSAAGSCASGFDESTGELQIQGQITSSLLAQWGLQAATLDGWLEDGLAYVNVHTALNPAGEARGQIIRQ